jgi:hypothetical protein
VVDSVGDTITEGTDIGIDLVNSTLATYTLGDNVENLTLTGAAVSGVGNTQANTLTGNALDNILDGGVGR